MAKKRGKGLCGEALSIAIGLSNLIVAVLALSFTFTQKK